MFFQDWFVPRRRQVGTGSLAGPEGLLGVAAISGGRAGTIYACPLVALSFGCFDPVTQGW